MLLANQKSLSLRYGPEVVENEDQLARALESATTEASSAFGDGGVYIEKYLSPIRHIEIQVMADSFGNCIHL